MQAEAEKGDSVQARAAAGAAADPLEGLDLAPLHRCLLVHSALGRAAHFLDYYRDNRRQQLASDLTPPANFLQAYEPFVAQARPSPSVTVQINSQSSLRLTSMCSVRICYLQSR